MPREIDSELDAYFASVERVNTKVYGDDNRPALVMGDLTRAFEWSALDPPMRIDPG